MDDNIDMLQNEKYINEGVANEERNDHDEEEKRRRV